MAVVPIEVIVIGDVPEGDVAAAMASANSAQKEFLFLQFPQDEAASLKMHAYTSIPVSEMFEILERFRNGVRGFHPFLIAIVDADLHGEKYGNLFGSHRGSNGIAIVTVSNVPDIIIPKDQMMAYILYYLARYALSFLAPNHMNHEDTRGCVFDRKMNKNDLVKSMRARALCDECRRNLVSEPGMMSSSQFEALDRIFSVAGQVLIEGVQKEARFKAFIGSSTEGLATANKIKELLSNDLSVVVWNDDAVFGLGEATLEALEAAVMEYQYGIFIFTPDDELHTRGETKQVARDNVLFELGLFIGKLGRRRAFVVNPGKKAVDLPSDLSGITTATYDPDERDLAAALGPVCNRLRNAINSAVI